MTNPPTPPVLPVSVTVSAPTVPRVLLIEDDAHSARLVTRLLTRAGMTVDWQEDGESGIMAAMSATPALVLVDLGLPDMDGQTVVALLRQGRALAGVPLVAFTAWPPEAAQAMARAYGCDGLISKPFNTRTLAAQVRGFLPKAAPPPVE